MKQEFLQIRMTEDEKNELAEFVSQLPNQDMTVSQFVRDAVRKEMATQRKRFERQIEQAAGVTA